MSGLKQIKTRGYNFMWREYGATVLLVDSILSNSFDSREEKLVIYNKPAAEGYISKEGQIIAQTTGLKIYTSKNAVDKLKKDGYRTAKELKKYIDKLTIQDFQLYSKSDLIKEFDKFLDMTEQVLSSYGLTEPRKAVLAEQKLQNFLLEKLKDKIKVNEALTILLAADTSQTIFNQEIIKRSELALDVSQNKEVSKIFDSQKSTDNILDKLSDKYPAYLEKIKKHQQDFGFISNVTGKVYWDLNYFIDAIQRLIRLPKKDIQKNIDLIIGNANRMQNERSGIMDEIGISSDMKLLIDNLTEASLLRLNLDPYWRSAAAIYFGVLAPAMADSVGMTANDINALTCDELKDLFIKDKKPDANKVKSRQDFYLAVQDNKGFHFYWDKDAKEVAGYIQKQSQQSFVDNMKQLRGTVASAGKITGNVKILHSSRGDVYEELSSVHEGNILVTEMTRPQFISAMKKTAAIVTDEGGLTSHAAIVARELKIPCVVGTKIATQVLHDGDLVEVDAINGIVRILKRS